MRGEAADVGRERPGRLVNSVPGEGGVEEAEVGEGLRDEAQRGGLATPRKRQHPAFHTRACNTPNRQHMRGQGVGTLHSFLVVQEFENTIVRALLPLNASSMT